MAKYLCMPNILWKIENVSETYKKMSPTIRFMGLKCHLILFRYVESGEPKLQLNLECQNASWARSWKFKIRVSIASEKNECYYMSKEGVYDLKEGECCIWTGFMHGINDTFPQKRNVIFSIVITPLGDFVAKLQSIKESDDGITEPTTCAVSLREDFSSLLKNGDFSDFTLKCGDKIFPVHKSILAARSHFFARMLRINMKETSENECIIKDMEPDILEVVLGYIYTGELPKLPIGSIQKVYAAADRFILESLKIKCHCLLIDNFTAGFKEDSEIESKDEQFKIIEGVEKDSKERRMLKDLFMSREWRYFFDEFPHKAHEMCKPYLFPDL